MPVASPASSLPMRPLVTRGFHAKPTVGCGVTFQPSYGRGRVSKTGLLVPFSEPGLNRLFTPDGPNQLAMAYSRTGNRETAGRELERQRKTAEKTGVGRAP